MMIVSITPNDIVETPAGLRVRVWDDKGSKYRETPLSLTVSADVNGSKSPQTGRIQ